MIYLMSQNIIILHSASVYSLIADEATDIRNKEQVFTIHEDALELTQLTKTDVKGSVISYKYATVMDKHYDEAANMNDSNT